MASVNAEEVNTNVLTKSDPDITDLQFDMLEGINTNETIQEQIDNVTIDITGLEADVLTLQGQMITANSNISTLQGQMTTANSNISTLQGQMTTANSNISTLNGEVNTLQSEMNTAQSEINTLQSEMNTAQSDINDLQADVIALGVTTGSNTAAIAGLSVSQALQDVTIAAHTASIGTLQGEMTTAQGQITVLQTKTTDQSWGPLTGTTFSRRVYIVNTGLSIGTDSVYLASSEASTFLYGISASAPITTTSTFSSTSGTSQVSSLLVNNNFEVTNISYFGDTLFCDRNALTTTKKLVLYDGNTDNNYDWLGFWTDSGTASKKFLNAEIDGVTGSAFQWYYGNNLGSARTIAKSLSSADEINYTPKATFLKSAGASQQIQLVRDTANSRVRIDMIGDTTGANTFDGQIIQQEGNGVDDNRGIMTIQSGDVTITAQTSATTGTLQMNAKVLDINASGNITIDGATTTTLTSVGETEINSAALDINASGAITIDGATTTVITSVDDMTLQTTNPFGDILVSSAGTTTLTSVGQTQVNSVELDINASGAITIDGATTTIITSVDDMTLQTTNPFGDILVSSAGTTTLTSVGQTQVNSAELDINATGAITIDGPTIGLTGATTILGTTNINTTGSSTATIGNSGAITNIIGVVTINDTGTSSTTIGNSAGNLHFEGNNNTILGTTTINTTGLGNTTIGNASAGTSIIGALTINNTGTSSTTIGNSSGLVEIEGATNTILGTTNINSANTSATTIGNTTGTLTLRGASTIINTTGTGTTSIGNTTGTLTLTGVTTDMNTDLRITQTNYTQPMSSSFQLGYTNTASSSAVMTATLTQRASFSIPQKGVWLIVLGYSWKGGATNVVTLRQALISTTSGGSAPAASGLHYYEELDVSVTTATQQQGAVMGVYTATSAPTTLYLNANATVVSGTLPTLTWAISWTRIG
jgi:outer membrane murein-binding lipoprotein Lpp